MVNIQIHSTYRYLKLIEKTTKNLPSFVSCYNGAWIKDLSDNKIHQNLIEHEVAFKFYELAKKDMEKSLKKGFNIDSLKNDIQEININRRKKWNF